MHVEAHEPVAGVDRSAGVQAHADADCRPFRPGLGQKSALRVEGGGDGDGRRFEDGEELVGATLDLAPAVPSGSRAELHARGREDVAVVGAETAHKCGRPLDVGEEKGELLLRHGLEGSSTVGRFTRRPARCRRCGYLYPALETVRSTESSRQSSPYT